MCIRDRSYEGQMGILKDHIPLITFLRPGLIIIKENSGEKIFFIEDGTVEFSNNNLLILTSTAKSLDSLDKNSIDVIIKKLSSFRKEGPSLLKLSFKGTKIKYRWIRFCLTKVRIEGSLNY